MGEAFRDSRPLRVSAVSLSVGNASRSEHTHGMATDPVQIYLEQSAVTDASSNRTSSGKIKDAGQDFTAV